MPTEKIANNPHSNLQSDISSAQTTLAVNNSSSFPSSGNFRIIIDSEIITVTGVSGTTFTIIRGQEGTTSTNHIAGAAIDGILTAGAINQMISDNCQAGIDSSLPASEKPGRLYFATDKPYIYRDNGSSWERYDYAVALGNIVENGNPGSVLYIDDSGNLAQSDNLFYNGKLGVGLNNPGDLLSVQDNTTNVRISVKNLSTSGYADLYASNDSNIYARVQSVGSAVAGTLYNLTAANLVRFTGNSTVAIGTDSNSPLVLITNQTERVRITASGNVGINNLNPTTKFSIQQDSADTSPVTLANTSLSIVNYNSTDGNYAALEFRSKDTGGTERSGASIAGIFTRSATMTAVDLAFYTRSIYGTINNPLYLKNGKVGIGTTSPHGKLTIDAGGGGTENIRIRDSVNGIRYRSDYFINGTSGTFLNSYDDTGTVYLPFQLDASKTILGLQGNVGIGTTGPNALLDISQSFTSSTTSFVRLTNTSSSGQTPLDFYINGTLRGKIRVDYAGNLILVSNGGDIDHFTGGDSGTGTNRLKIRGSDGYVGIGTSSPNHILSVNGSLDIANNSGGSSNRIYLAGSDTNHYIYSTGSGNHTYFGEYQGNFHFYDTLAAADVVTITGGKVGIGTTSPDAPLTVQATSTSDDIIRMKNSSGTTKWHFSVYGGVDFNIAESGVADGRIYIKAGGNVGIGTTSPSDKLTVAGAIRTTSNAVVNAASAGDMDFLSGNLRLISRGANTSTAGGFQLISCSSDSSVNNTLVTITNSGNVGIGTTSPVSADGSSRTLQLLNTVILQNVVGNQLLLSNNAYYDGSSWKYATTATAAAIRVGAENAGEITFHTVGSGTAGTSISGWDSTALRMTIANNGNVGIGTNSTDGIFHVNMAASSDAGAPKFYSNGMASGAFAEILIGESRNTYKQCILRYTNGAGTASNANIWLGHSGDSSGQGLYIVGGGSVSFGVTYNLGSYFSSNGFQVATNVSKDATAADNSVAFFGSNNSTYPLGLLIGFRSTSKYIYIQGTEIGTAANNIVFQRDGGYVGIGNINPSYPLHISASNFPVLRVDSSHGSGSCMDFNATGTSGRNWRFQSTASSASEGAGKLLIADITAGGVRMTFDSSGQVGIGITGPSYTLDVNGSIHYSGSLVGPSDERFKTKIETMNNVLVKFKNIKPIKFEWNDKINKIRKGFKKNKLMFGLLAQEVEKEFPEIVDKYKINEEITDARGIQYDKLIPILFQAVKELAEQVEVLNNK